MGNGKRIAIISFTYFWLPTEAGPTRFYYIAKKLSDMGYDVEVITGSFHHYSKTQRDARELLKDAYPFKITFLDMPSYRKNIDLRRIRSYAVAKKNLLRYLEQKKDAYDAIYCSLPPNDIAAAAARHCDQYNIPFVVDVEDLWPEGMEFAFPNLPGKKILLHGFHRDAEEAYKYADAVVGTSDEFTRRAFRYQDLKIPYKTIYVGCSLSDFDGAAEVNLESVEKGRDEFWAVYAGSIGNSYDIKSLVEAGFEIQRRGYDKVRIKILGQGVLKDELEQLAQKLGCKNVEFAGYVPYARMAAYLVKSDVTLNLFVKGVPHSIVNKVGDYFAAGKPIISSLESREFTGLVEENRIGINIPPEDPRALADAIVEMYKDKKLCYEMGCNARKLAERSFDRDETYAGIAEIIEAAMRNKAGIHS